MTKNSRSDHKETFVINTLKNRLIFKSIKFPCFELHVWETISSVSVKIVNFQKNIPSELLVPSMHYAICLPF